MTRALAEAARNTSTVTEKVSKRLQIWEDTQRKNSDSSTYAT